MDKNRKWLFISMIGLLVFLALMVASDCNAEMRTWRGYKAVFMGLFLAGGGALSIITMIIQTLRVASTSRSKFGGISFVYDLIFISVVMALEFSKQCNGH
jgi:hypothetical protein